jgi:tight adherence protein C
VVDATHHRGGRVSVLVLPLAWSATVLALAWRHRPPRRRPVLVTSARQKWRADVTRTAVFGAIALLAPLPIAVAMVLGAWAWPVLQRRRSARARADAIARSLPEVVDLVHLAVGAGLTIRLALDAVVRRGDGPIVAELAAALHDVELGRRLADALEDVPSRTDEGVRPLVAALVASDRYGAPLGDALDRLALEVRADRRRRAEEAARKVPVKLLFPLVCCVLPAFVLLTLAPLVAGAVAALRLQP